MSQPPTTPEHVHEENEEGEVTQAQGQEDEEEVKVKEKEGSRRRRKTITSRLRKTPALKFITRQDLYSFLSSAGVCVAKVLLRVPLLSDG